MKKAKKMASNYWMITLHFSSVLLDSTLATLACKIKAFKEHMRDPYTRNNLFEVCNSDNEVSDVIRELPGLLVSDLKFMGMEPNYIAINVEYALDESRTVNKDRLLRGFHFQIFLYSI